MKSNYDMYQSLIGLYSSFYGRFWNSNFFAFLFELESRRIFESKILPIIKIKFKSRLYIIVKKLGNVPKYADLSTF